MTSAAPEWRSTHSLDQRGAIVYSSAPMSPLPATATMAATLGAALVIGRRLRIAVPASHLDSEAKDTVKFAMGMVATMTALLLGLLVTSAKSNYDDQRNQVITMGAKVIFLHRVLALYGPEAAPARQSLRTVVGDAIARVWPSNAQTTAELGPNENAGNSLLTAIQTLAPQNDTQRALKDQATSLVIDLGEMRTLLQAQSIPSVSPPLFVAVGIWLVVIFASASMLAPPNATTLAALGAAACSVIVAVYLILELDQPFGGVLRISSAPLEAALHQLTP